MRSARFYPYFVVSTALAARIHLARITFPHFPSVSASPRNDQKSRILARCCVAADFIQFDIGVASPSVGSPWVLPQVYKLVRLTKPGTAWYTTGTSMDTADCNT